MLNEKDQNNEDYRLIYEFPKNSQENIQVSLKTYRGTSVIDIRVFFPIAGGAPRPTKKGITISTKLLPELTKSVNALKEHIDLGNQHSSKDALQTWLDNYR